MSADGVAADEPDDAARERAWLMEAVGPDPAPQVGAITATLRALGGTGDLAAFARDIGATAAVAWGRLLFIHLPPHSGALAGIRVLAAGPVLGGTQPFAVAAWSPREADMPGAIQAAALGAGAYLAALGRVTAILAPLDAPGLATLFTQLGGRAACAPPRPAGSRRPPRRYR